MTKILIAAAIVAIVTLAVWTGMRRDAGPVLAHEDPAIVAVGKELYLENCAACHGAALEGQRDWRSPLPSGRMPAPPHDETGHTWHHPDAQLFALTKNGVAALVGQGYESDMPGFAGILSDDEIAASLAYIKSTWPDDIIARHDALNAAAVVD